IDAYIASLGIPPGPITQQGIYASPQLTGQPYPSAPTQNANENQEPPQGWPRQPVFNTPNDVPGPPVQFGPPITPTDVKAGEGFVGNGLPEKDVFYYHPDHLGSSSYISTLNGQISQHVEYIAFGEVLFEEHSSSFKSPYLFNGKELDRETNLTNFGARYLDMKTSLWLSVDPLAEKGPEYSPYSFCFNNPMHFTDPDGRWPDFPASFQNAFKGAVNGVVNSVKQKYNDAKTSVSRSYNQAKTSLVQAKDNAVKTTKQALNDGQKWVKDNKQGLLKTAQGMQDAGDAITITGGVIAVGTAATGVGIGVGATVAAYGEGLGLLGKGVEVLTLAIAGDTNEAVNSGVKKGAWMVAGKVADVLIDRAIPGPTPDVSNNVAEGLQNACNVGNDLLKTTTKAKMTVVEGAVSDKNK
ncbi:RHS repeat domain-containing protein, partial [Flavobacterium psychrophilum]|uniref:RHS repeat domain-containing protein n=1 Tax=Flavobacterium psychrophilum TaxID=96345 RepID=UPI000AEFCE8E